MSTAALHKAFAEAGVSEELIEEAINELHEEIAESRKEVVTKSYLDSALARLETSMTQQLYSLEISMTKQLYKVVTGVITAALVIGLAAIALMINLSINLIKL